MKEQIEQKAQALRLSMLEGLREMHEQFRKYDLTTRIDQIHDLKEMVSLLNALDPDQRGLLSMGSYAALKSEGKE